jgi:hypothetical protein
MDLKEMGCEDVWWLELPQDRVLWQALLYVVLNLRVLLPESYLISKMDLREMGCEDVWWLELAQDHVQWQALLYVVLNLWVLLLDSQLAYPFSSSSLSEDS